jgi:hypothetical protein
MEDFEIGITLDVFDEGKKIKTFNGNVLSDDTIHMIMEDIARMELRDEEELNEIDRRMKGASQWTI